MAALLSAAPMVVRSVCLVVVMVPRTNICFVASVVHFTDPVDHCRTIVLP